MVIAGIKSSPVSRLRYVLTPCATRTREIGDLMDGRTYTEVDIMRTGYKPVSIKIVMRGSM